MNKFNVKGATWDSLFLTLAKVLTMVFGIVLSKVVSTGLSLSEYGTYAQVNLVTSIGTSIILLGTPDALNYFFNKKNENDYNTRCRIINTVFFIELVAGVMLAMMIALGRNLIERYFSNLGLHSILIIASVLPMLGNIIYLYQMLYVSAGKAKLMSLYNLILMILKIISAYTAVYILRDIIWIYVVLLVLDLIQILVFKATLARRDVKINPFKISTQYVRPILAYSLPMGVYSLTNILNRDLDKLIIGRLAGTETLAIYTNCSKILPFDFLAVSFATVLIPYIVKYVTDGNKETTIRLFSGYIKIGYYSVWILGSAVLIAPKTMIRFLYAEAYTAGLSVFIVYILDSMLRFASMHLILTSANKTKKLMLYSLLTLGLNLVLNILLYFLFGMIGPAIATLLVSLIYTWLVLNATIKIIDIKWRDVFNIKEISFLLISLVVLGIGARWINALCINAGWNHYLAMLFAIAIFGIVSLLIHAKKIFAVLKEINSFRM
jgi:O-antigen/teichoic acid export membrane protein